MENQKEPYWLKNGDMIYAVGMQDFDNNEIIVQTKDNREVKCEIKVLDDGEIGFVFENEFVYFSHYMNNDQHKYDEWREEIFEVEEPMI